MIDAHIIKQLCGSEGEFKLNVQFNISQGEFVALYGDSGAGKTTLMRCLAGLDMPDEGNIKVNEKTWFDFSERVNMPIQQRHVGFMFQDYALFPNMTVRQNLAFALAKSQPKHRIAELLDMMEIGELQHQKPAQLSGGQKQRVALARTLAQAPQLMLLDEPFAALDTQVRSRLQDEILRLHRHFGLTILLISHDVGEVYKLASRVLVMHNGMIQQDGTSSEVFVAGQTSGKFKLSGEVLAIEKTDVMSTLTVLVANQIVRILVMQSEAENLNIGSKVALVSKAFNPMVFKIA
jgi:molybdate transport system ATP-binding protein